MTPDPGATPAPAAASHQGFFSEAVSLFGSFSRHFQAVFSLAGLEAKEAIGLYVRLVVMLVAALLFALLGYVFLILTAAFAIAWLCDVAWIWIALGFAVLHFLVCFLCALHVKKHFRTPVFQTTSSELRKDFALLSAPDVTPQP
jgi:uncharacterized membrane protein YqjE